MANASSPPEAIFLPNRWQPFVLHPPVLMIVGGTREDALHALVSASKPSSQRLHLRNLFTEGRRYYMQSHKDGFKLTCDSKVPWGSRRRRSPTAALMYGTVNTLSKNVTMIRLRARMRWVYQLAGLFVPTWMALIVVSMPWSLRVMAAVVLALYTLALVGYRLNAALQAADMVFFVQKALEDLPPAPVAGLGQPTPEVVQAQTQRDFREQWERFYEEVSGGED